MEEKVRNNIAYLVSVHTVTDDGKVHHRLSCLQDSREADIIYNKSSHDLKKKNPATEDK
jgi:hypothetical protein